MALSFVRTPQARWLAASALVFLTSTTIAFLQSPRPNVYREPPPTERTWWQYPLETNPALRLPLLGGAVLKLARVPGTRTVWAVGLGGLALVSQDEGRTWTHRVIQLPAQASGASSSQTEKKELREDLYDLWFTDARQGWMAYRDGLLHTIDGGQTWKRQSVTGGTIFSESFASLYFFDAATGWVAGPAGLWQTSDGGRSWRLGEKSGFSWSTVTFVNREKGWAAGRNLVAETHDGGSSWNLFNVPLARNENVEDIQFQNVEEGWILGDEGSLVRTRDGGETWQKLPLPKAGWNYLGIHFADAQRGWTLGSPFLTTQDGGRRWRAGHSQADIILTMLPLEGGAGLAAGSTLLRTEDGGKTWRHLFRSAAEVLLDVTWADEDHVWIGRQLGGPLISSDGGKRWQPLRGLRVSFLSPQFVDRNVGWALDLKGTLLRTTDGGGTWQIEPGAPPLVSKFHFADRQNGWAATISGSLHRTTDGGVHWAEIRAGWGYSPEGEQLSLHVTDGESGWVLVYEGGTWKALRTRNHGQKWEVVGEVTKERLLDSELLDDRIGFVLTEQSLLATQNGGVIPWEHRDRSLPVAKLHAIDFPDADNGWAVGEDGAIFATRDGGLNWSPQESGIHDPLLSVRFINPNVGCAVGALGSILMTRDGGATWRQANPHRIGPAPWYYAALVLSLVLALPGLRLPRSRVSERLSVADVLASDRPLELGDRDALNLGPVAEALSRFLRNENTKPPLTIAVTGAWGSGKSSLMNLLRGDLQSHGFRTVWFNAWHHQKEEHLLAALLENIRLQAVPPVWARGGLAFRLRLLSIRGLRLWFVALLVLFGLALYSGHFLAGADSVDSLLDKLTGMIGRWAPWLIDAEAPKDTAASPVSFPGGATVWLAWLAGLGALLETLRRGLTAFGKRPARLAASVSSRLHIGALEGQLGFRSQFSREFGDVTRALGNRSMVVLIDDLDRCQPTQVLEILESVNFLVSSGECVVVMGLDLARVERSIGLALGEVAEEMENDTHVTGDDAAAGEDAERERRVRFARRYLEKLINIEVPIPIPSADEFAGLFDLVLAEPERRSVAEWLRLSLQWSRRAGAVLLGLGVVAGGLWLGLADEAKPQQVVTAKVENLTQNRAAEPPQPQEVGESGTNKLPAGPGPSALPEQRFEKNFEGPARIYPGEKKDKPLALMLLPLTLLAFFVGRRLFQAQDDIVRDSPEFVRALVVWNPFLFSRRNTPRSAKRFLNRVRYYAMFQRDPAPPAGPVQRLLARWEAPRRPRTETQIPEAALVALAAIQHCEEGWLDDDHLYADLGEYLRECKIPHSMERHLEELSRLGSLDRYRTSFTRISSGIRVT